MTRRFSPGRQIESFRYALRGMGVLLRDQHNARIHLIATAVVVSMALYLNVNRVDWALLLFAVALVWLAEALNSSLEYLADAVHPKQHPLIGKAKDVAAAGVLLAAIAAAATGLFVFVPYLVS